MRVLFSSTSGYGHVFPMVPLARALQAAGHQVRWATGPGALPLVEAAGIPVVPAGPGPAEIAAGRQQVLAAAAGLSPDQLAAFVFPHMFGGLRAPAMFADLLPLAQSWQPDLIVHEMAELAGPLVAAVLGIPGAAHAFGGAIPAEILEEAGDHVAPLWATQGLARPPFAGCYDHVYLDICPPSVQTGTLPRAMSVLPLRPVPYTGAEQDRMPASLDHDDGLPLVYVTLGTVDNRSSVLQGVVAELAPRGYRLLVTVGPNGDPAALGPQPETVTVERYVSQTTVLPRCAAVVSHAGSGTFLAALGLGLPQVLLPQGADQFRNAEACTLKGLGVALRPGEATPVAVAEALDTVLTDPSYRSAAEAGRDEIATMPSPAAVADRLVLLTGR